MLPTQAAPRLARSIRARSRSGAVHDFNPLVNTPSGSSRIVEKPLQPLPPRGRATRALARSGAVSAPFGAEAAPHRANSVGHDLCRHPARTAALVSLERGRQDGSWRASSGACCNASRTTDRSTESSQTLIRASHPERMSGPCIAASIPVAAEALVQRESATCWSYTRASCQDGRHGPAAAFEGRPQHQDGLAAVTIGERWISPHHDNTYTP